MEGKTHCKYCRVSYSPLVGKPRAQSVKGADQKGCSSVSHIRDQDPAPMILTLPVYDSLTSVTLIIAPY